MTKYRIVPHWTKSWVVQRHVLWGIWGGVYGVFDSESAAEERIRGLLSMEGADMLERKYAKERRKRYVPRVFP